MVQMQAEKLQLLKDAEREQEHALAGAIKEDRLQQQKECGPLSFPSSQLTAMPALSC